MDLTGLNLPASVTERLHHMPMEDLMLKVLREALPDIKVSSLINFQLHDIDTFILVRRTPGDGYWRGRSNLLDEGGMTIQVYTRDPDADVKGALVSEAVRDALMDAVKESTYYPGLGQLKYIRMIEEPLRKSDWTTATGPVQFADLPNGFFRYETRYTFKIRPPLWG